MSEITFRTAVADDAEALLKIYAPYVENTAVTFEYLVPTVEEFKKRITDTLKKYPYIVALKDEKIVGYVYASRFHERDAYNWCVETSIYVDMDYRGMGIGKKLYTILEEKLKEMNILNLYACIAYTDYPDGHLTTDSVKFHEHLGYKICGHHTACGYKFNTWYDMVWMEKMLGSHTLIPAAPNTFSGL